MFISLFLLNINTSIVNCTTIKAINVNQTNNNNLIKYKERVKNFYESKINNNLNCFDVRYIADKISKSWESSWDYNKNTNSLINRIFIIMFIAIIAIILMLFNALIISKFNLLFNNPIKSFIVLLIFAAIIFNSIR